MIKFYRNITDYAKQNGICRQTAMKKFKAGELDIIEVPRLTKFIGIRLK